MGGSGKRVSWVELYLDVVFVLAVGQIAHVIADRPAMRSAWIALGLFATLWWTWMGSPALYTRHGDDAPEHPVSRGSRSSSRRSSSPACAPSCRRTRTSGCSPPGR